MGSCSAWRLILLCVAWGGAVLLHAQGLLPAVQERRLANGARILLVERSGTGSVHARLFLQGGQADTGTLPSAASELLARSLFGTPVEGEQGDRGELESLLKREEGAYEALRLGRIREARRASSEGPQEVQDLEALHRQVLDRIRERESRGRRLDPLEAAGAVRREVLAAADFISFAVDLPREGLERYAACMADRLAGQVLARFPLERERLLEEARSAQAGSRKVLSVFLGAALSGQPYARFGDLQQASLEAVTWSDLRGLARRIVVPGRLVLVLVGDVRMTEVSPLFERAFGAWSPGPEGLSIREDMAAELGEGSGSLRLQASVPRETRLLMGWRVPPMTHPDHAALLVVAQMLGGGYTSRLADRVMSEQGLAQSCSVRLGVPGGRSDGLLLIEARPADRHDPRELEQVVQGEVIRLQRGTFGEGEIRRAQRQVEAGQFMVQEDAATLADALGTAQCQGGDWRLAFRALNARTDFTPLEIQQVALRYLALERSTVGFFEPDPILASQDPLEERTAQVLAKILAARLGDPGRAEALVREALRQLRMLPLKDREQTLRLLESQVAP